MRRNIILSLYTYMMIHIITGAVLVILLVPHAAFGTSPNDTNIPPAQSDLSQHPKYRNYRFGQNPDVVDMGYQPLWHPPGMIAETMQHDGILQKALMEIGVEIRFHPFAKVWT